jgi:quinol monooxygenase YgiN
MIANALGGTDLFCVIYEWKVRPGKEDQFRETWRNITEAIFHQHGSLGSRLHHADDGRWIAYAQWPDREHWEHHADTIGVELERSRQAQALDGEAKVLFRLTVTDDLLKPAPFESCAAAK